MGTTPDLCLCGGPLGPDGACSAPDCVASPPARRSDHPPVVAAAERYPAAPWYLRNAREAFRMTRAGLSFNMGHHGQYGEYGPATWPAEFVAALNRRINVKGRLPVAVAPWRKLDPDWQRAAYQLAWRVNYPRLIVRITECPPDFRARLAHRLTDPREEF